MARQKAATRNTNGAGERRYASRFAEELQQWLWHGRGYDKPAWSRRKLGEALANSREGVQVSYSTIDKWFNAGTMPEPEAFWALVRVTGWEPEKLRELTGYSEVPPHVTGFWEFLHGDLEQEATIDPLHKRIVRAWLERAQIKFNNLPKRPRRRNARAAMAAPTTAPDRPERSTSAETAVETRVETDDEVTARRRGLVGAGK